MEEKRCKKCQRKLPMDYKHARCEHCRGRSAQRAKKVGLGVLGAFGVISAVGVAIANVLGNNDDGEMP